MVARFPLTCARLGMFWIERGWGCKVYMYPHICLWKKPNRMMSDRLAQMGLCDNRNLNTKICAHRTTTPNALRSDLFSPPMAVGHQSLTNVCVCAALFASCALSPKMKSKSPLNSHWFIRLIFTRMIHTHTYWLMIVLNPGARVRASRVPISAAETNSQNRVHLKVRLAPGHWK